MIGIKPYTSRFDADGYCSFVLTGNCLPPIRRPSKYCLSPLLTGSCITAQSGLLSIKVYWIVHSRRRLEPLLFWFYQSLSLPLPVNLKATPRHSLKTQNVLLMNTLPPKTPSVLVMRFALLFLLFLSLLLAGCPKPPLQGSYPPPEISSPLDDARNAFVSGNFAKAETLALRLSSVSSLSQQESTEASRILVAAALQNKHPTVALTALDQWRLGSPGADETREWQDAWAKAMRSLSSHDARTRANDIYQDASRSTQVRSIAGVFLAVRQWQGGELGQSMAVLENIYSTAADTKEKAVLEQRLALELHLATPAASTLAASVLNETNQGKFPYSLILIDKLRRESNIPQTRDAALAALSSLSGTINLADPSLLQSVPSETNISIQRGAGTIPSGPIAGQPVVLALPLTGQYAAVSGKIASGAQIACAEMSASGHQVSLMIIDTDQGDWLTKLEQLPQNAAIVGGPLRRDDYIKAKAQGLTSRKAIFAFLPGLEPGDEGQIAWRFFSGARDQIDTLLGFTSRLGISGYAVFYPEENFGHRMASLFEERARALGAKHVITQGYVPGDQNNWMASARNLLSTNKSGSAFQAIFLPDSWKTMDTIVPNFFYYNETRQVLLGTTLWEQELAGGHAYVNMQYYNLAVFPGSWNSAQLSPSGQSLQAGLQSMQKGPADFWNGLGYDFARFSVNLGLREGWSPGVVNSALQSISMGWSIAPITWSNGVATQQMHLFQPTSSGFSPLDEYEFQNSFNQAWN